MTKTSIKEQKQIIVDAKNVLKGVKKYKSSNFSLGKSYFVKNNENLNFLWETNRKPDVFSKKFVDKAKDQSNTRGNIIPIIVCRLNGKNYIADGQHRYIIGKALNLPIMALKYNVKDYQGIYSLMKSININQNAWDNKQAVKFFSGNGGNRIQKANYKRIDIAQRQTQIPFSNWFEVQAYFTYQNKIKSLEDIRGYSMKISKGFKDGHYRISPQMYSKCCEFISQFKNEKVEKEFWRNAKVLRCIMRLFAINQEKMKIKRLIQQIKKHHNLVDTKQDDTKIQADIKKIYEKGNTKISLVA
jgi:hypothetical protein